MYTRPYFPNRAGRFNSSFRPKKPVRSFQDLEVYQNALGAAVAIATHIYPPLAARSAEPVSAPKKGLTAKPSPPAVKGIAVPPRATSQAPPAYPFLDTMLKLSLEIPRFIAEAHSLRFDFPDKAVIMLERARFCCNRMIVYLEQVRDIYAADIDRSAVEEITKKYGYNRMKIFRLAAAWKRWAGEKK